MGWKWFQLPMKRQDQFAVDGSTGDQSHYQATWQSFLNPGTTHNLRLSISRQHEFSVFLCKKNILTQAIFHSGSTEWYWIGLEQEKFDPTITRLNRIKLEYGTEKRSYKNVISRFTWLESTIYLLLI